MNRKRAAGFYLLIAAVLLLVAYRLANAADYQTDLDGVASNLSADSQLVIVGIGPSIMQNSLNGFMPFLSRPEVNDNIIFVDCSLGSNQQRFENPDYFGWQLCIDRLAAVGQTAGAVDVAFYYNALTGPSGTFDEYVLEAADSFTLTYGHIADKFPNVQLILQNSQHYAGWCGNCKAPEPYAEWSRYAVDELIRRRADGEITGPLIAWNAYQWDDTWPANYYSDGLHLSSLGQQATGQLWHDYLSVTSFTAPWYLDGPALPTVTPGPTNTPGPTATASPTPSGATATPETCGRQNLPCPPTRIPGVNP